MENEKRKTRKEESHASYAGKAKVAFILRTMFFGKLVFFTENIVGENYRFLFSIRLRLQK